MPKNIKIIFIIFATFFVNTLYAEGQEGIGSIISFGYSFMAITNLLIYTVLGGLVLRFLFRKVNPEIKNGNFIFFFLAFVISIFLTIILGKEFVFRIYNIL